ncbi:MAG TPA: hypothetical protein VLF90_02485 [Patescibacteria group bacterium]|nr:hypothetical protein [Patescibacteria group bacterium]
MKKTRNAKLVDRATFLAAIIEPLVTIPQAMVIFKQHSAAGVSLSTWVGYEVLTLVWIWYGIVHKEKMILLYQGLFLIIQTIVIIGGLMYGAKW